VHLHLDVLAQLPDEELDVCPRPAIYLRGVFSGEHADSHLADTRRGVEALSRIRVKCMVRGMRRLPSPPASTIARTFGAAMLRR
jgi:hypothetical protein